MISYEVEFSRRRRIVQVAAQVEQCSELLFTPALYLTSFSLPCNRILRRDGEAWVRELWGGARKVGRLAYSRRWFYGLRGGTRYPPLSYNTATSPLRKLGVVLLPPTSTDENRRGRRPLAARPCRGMESPSTRSSLFSTLVCFNTLPLLHLLPFQQQFLWFFFLIFFLLVPSRASFLFWYADISDIEYSRTKILVHELFFTLNYFITEKNLLHPHGDILVSRLLHHELYR